MTPDRELLTGWVSQGDEAAFRSLVERHAAFLASMRRAKAPARGVLEELLKSDFRVNGKPPQFAVFETTATWFAKEPAAAWDWMVRAVATGDYPFDRRRPWGQEQMSQWLGRDPASALAALAPLPPEWDNFSRKALSGGLEKEEQRKVLWPAIQQADDRTALMVAGSQPKPSDWSRDTLLPWLMTREWTNGVTPERIAHEWTWHNGTLDNERFRMLCEAVGTLPTEAANQAAAAAIREAVRSSESADRTRFLEHLLPDPASRERLLKAL